MSDQPSLPPLTRDDLVANLERAALEYGRVMREPLYHQRRGIPDIDGGLARDAALGDLRAWAVALYAHDHPYQGAEG